MLRNVCVFCVERGRLIPDFIRGDFDSIRDDVRSHYATRTSVVHEKCQDTTDFEKCLQYLSLTHATNVVICRLR